MSVIENALRRAQEQQRSTEAAPVADSPVAEPAAVGPAAVVSMAPARTPAAVRSGRRMPSLATILLVGLTVTTFVILRQPGWGRGFERWFSNPKAAPEIAQVVAPRGATPQVAVQSLHPAAVAPVAVVLPAGDTLYSAPRVEAPAVPAGTTIMSPAPASLDGVIEPQVQAFTGLAVPTQGSGAKPTGAAPEVVAGPSQADVQTRFRVSGVMLSGRMRTAVINGAIVAEGERIENAIVRRVGPQSVTIEIDGRTFSLGLRPAR